MVSTCKKRQSNRTLFRQLDDFDHDIVIGNTMSDRQEIVAVNEGTADQEFTINNFVSNSAANETSVNVKTLARCLNERIDREMGLIVDTVEDRIQNVMLTAIDSIISRKIDLAIGSLNASSGRDANSVVANSERGEHIGVYALFQNVSERKNTLHVFNKNDETRNNIPDEVTELSVPGTHFNRQPHTHHSNLI